MEASQANATKVLLLVDNTGSMGNSCTSARTSAHEINALCSLLLGRDGACSFAVYGDYDHSTPKAEQGGWSILKGGGSNQEQEDWFKIYMKPCGGGGAPEAQRTAFNKILENLTEPHIIFHYTDAPYHSAPFDTEGRKEEKYLQKHGYIRDWDQLTSAVKTKHRVVTFLTAKSQDLLTAYSKVGDVVTVRQNTSDVLTKTMMTVLYSLWGQSNETSGDNEAISYYRIAQTGDSVAQEVNWSCPACTFLNAININRCIMCEARRIFSQNTNANGKLHQSTDIEPQIRLNLRAKLREAEPLHVFSAFEKLLDEKRPTSILCLTTNRVLGKYWRLVCGRFRFANNGEYEKMANALVDKLGQIKNKLPNAQQTIMKEWLDESHDATPTIRHIVSNMMEEEAWQAKRHVLILPGIPDISVDDVLLLGRGASNFHELSKLIATVTLVHAKEGDKQYTIPEDDEESPAFIPFIPEHDGGEGKHPKRRAGNVFKLLANLLKPGLLFGSNTAMLAAALALKNKHLGSLAEELLARNKGKWIDWSIKEDGTQNYPPNWSVHFMRILTFIPETMLTDEEMAFRDKYLTVSRVIRNHDVLVSFQTGQMLQGRMREDFTYKRKCDASKGGCGEWRCFTIFPGSRSICGICITEKSPAFIERLKAAGRYKPGMEHRVKKEKTPATTHWVQCGTCTVNYGVTATEDLNVRPKCYHCRYFRPRAAVTCMHCKLDYVSEDGAGMLAMEAFLEAVLAGNKIIVDKAKEHLMEASRTKQFLCPRCVHDPSGMVVEVEAKICDIIAENKGAIIPYIPVTPYDTLMETQTKLWRRVLAVDVNNNNNNVNMPPPSPLTYKKYTVHDSAALQHACVANLVENDGKATCQMCVEDVAVREMVLACGHCTQRMCVACVHAWYGAVTPGRMVAQGNTQCPFCKQPPTFSTIRALPMRMLKNIRPTKRNKGVLCEWDANMVYAACTTCLNVVGAVERECVRGDDEYNIENFTCPACAENTQTTMTLDTKECPSCKAPTHKYIGCDHINCTVCDEHWCWSCGKGGFDDNTIYHHLEYCG
eukprot:m.25264 g.25264  ORF g.25264 m.25264 type:complete len:1051 (-) comp7691_c0_seq1:148-3300(-)